MHDALGLSGERDLMIGITLALGVGGIVALAMALFWPRRWRLHYRMEVFFVVLLAALMVFADSRSAATYGAYEADLPSEAALSGKIAFDTQASGFDRAITVYAYQWGFLFFDETGAASRNAVKVAPGQKVLFTIVANDVIHGFNIPAVGLTTEFEPGETRAIWIRAPDDPGKYLIQCLNYCGLGHSQMKAWLVVSGDGHEDQQAHG
jgi:heme/copper-type cytochrome/quinol oxidase subunit 2